MKKRNNPKIEAMKKRSLIVENERKNLHTPKFYITEQEEEIKRPAGDPYEYKKEGDKYFFRKKGEENWKQTNNSAVKSVFGDVSSSKQTTTSKKETNVSSGKPKNIKGFQQWVINTKGDKSILGKGGDSGYGDDGMWGTNTAAAWKKYGGEYQNKDKNKEKKSENDNVYTKLKNNSTPENIAKMIKDSYGGTFGNDKEAWAQSAFEAITDKSTYEKVKSELGQDPYNFVKSFMSTNKDYHNNGKTIDGEYKRIMGDDEGKNKKIAQEFVDNDFVTNPDAHLEFDGDTLKWVSSGEVIKEWGAESGLTILNTPPSDYNKLIKKYIETPEEWVKEKNAGPIPMGTYTVGPIQEREVGTDFTLVNKLNAFFNEISGEYENQSLDFNAKTEASDIGWGRYRAPIIDSEGYGKKVGRGSFYIHGGAFSGSHGCIDLTNEMPDFAKFYTTWMASTRKKGIRLKVKYPNNLASTIKNLWDEMSLLLA